MESVKDKQQNTYSALQESQGYENSMQTPRLEKVVVSVGTGSFRDNKDKVDVVVDRLARITGQQPVARGAKKSNASFKIREGDVIGYQVTLRGSRMHAFLDKLIHLALPRTKDFRGVSPDAIDEMGNITIGVREHTIFPETSDEELRNVFGMGITIATTAQSADEARAFFDHLGIPFQKKDEA